MRKWWVVWWVEGWDVTYYLHVGQRNVEVRGEVRVPHHAHIGQEEGTQVSLLRRQVPHSSDLGDDLLLWKQNEFSVLYDGTAQLQISVQFRGLIGPASKKENFNKIIPNCNPASTEVDVPQH